MLTDRYRIPGQFRLDEGKSAAEGRCFDGSFDRRAGILKLYIRDSQGATLDQELTVDEVEALRDGLNRVLIEAKREREITVQVGVVA